MEGEINGDFKEEDVWAWDALRKPTASTSDIKSVTKPQTFPSAAIMIPGKSPQHGDESEDDDDEGYGEGGGEYGRRVAPHELIAKRVERGQISSFSVMEGVGRKLKGRDLSKVRNAVLTRTGFLESV